MSIPFSRAVIVTILALLFSFSLPFMTHAQGRRGGGGGGGGGGGETPQGDPQQRISQMLDMARGSTPQQWSQKEKRMLENMENHMKEKNTQDPGAITEAVQEIRRTLEQARGLSESEFAAQKASLQKDLMQWMGKGMGRSAGGGEGGGQGGQAGNNDQPPSGRVDPSPDPSDNLSGISYIDVHTHLMTHPMGKSGGSAGDDYEGAAQTALTAMDKYGIQKSLLMPQPFPPDRPSAYDCEKLVPIVKKAPGRFGFLGGGGTLNPMIHDSVLKGNDGSDVRRKFEEKAEEILRNGAAGFGEMAAEHLAFTNGHPYESAPPDHPLFLLLADIAARNNVPIDLHMEAVQHDMPVPKNFKSPPNPTTLRENIAGFERLLSHNPKARIVWAHVGWDNTGFGTVELYRQLLKNHPNLFMSVKIDFMGLAQSRPLDDDEHIKPEWLELLRSFPDRFVIGSDEFYSSPHANFKKLDRSRSIRIFLNQLPADLARKVASENATRIYRLSSPVKVGSE